MRIFSTSVSEMSEVRTEMSRPSVSCTTAVGKPGVLDGRARVADGDVLAGGELDDAATGELDPEVEAAHHHARDGQHQHAGVTARYVLRYCMRSGLRASSQLRNRPSVGRPVSPGRFASSPRLRPNSVSTRVTSSADTTEASTPMTSVTPKPRTGPDASTNSSPAASRVVTLESAIALNALEKPLSRAGSSRLLREAAYSSRARSKTSTLASMARPADSSRPPRPGRVRVAPSATSAP